MPAPETEIPVRFQRAEQVFVEKLWREQLRDWEDNRKPSSIATHRELQAVDPDARSDEELIACLKRCRDHHQAMIAQHMRFTAGAGLPVGDFLAHVGDWTGLPPSDLLGLMRGSAEVSSGGSAEMERLKAAFSHDAAAREVLASDRDPAEVLSSLRSLEGENWRGGLRLPRPGGEPSHRRFRYRRAFGWRGWRNGCLVGASGGRREGIFCCLLLSFLIARDSDQPSSITLASGSALHTR